MKEMAEDTGKIAISMKLTGGDVKFHDVGTKNLKKHKNKDQNCKYKQFMTKITIKKTIIMDHFVVYYFFFPFFFLLMFFLSITSMLNMTSSILSLQIFNLRK